MLNTGEDVVRRLASVIDRHEHGASSHWLNYHKTFAFEDGGFRGLHGFGGSLPPRSVLHRGMHRIMQTPVRRLGRSFDTFDEDYRLGQRVARRQGRQFCIDLLRHVLTLSFLRAHAAPARLEGPFVVIGDGFATMTALLLASFPTAKVVFVNLTKTLLVDVVFVGRAVPSAGCALAETGDEYAEAMVNPAVRAVAVRADDARVIAHGPIGLAVNIHSMQEMNPSTIAGYFDVLRAAVGGPPLFYCCNRVEKRLPDGTITRFADYPWSDADEVVVDGRCPWDRFTYVWRPPFYRRYIGPIWHRLAGLGRAGPLASGKDERA